MKFKPNLKLWATLPVIVLLFSILFITSCKKDDPPGVDAGSGKITMKVDGVNWESKDALDGAVILNSLGSLQISGYAEDDSQIGFALVTPTQGSTWNFDNGGSLVYKPDQSGSGWVHLAGGGTSSITFSTFNDNKAAGVFSATVVSFDSLGNQQEMIISDGSFDLNF